MERVYLVTLAKDTEPPLGPRSDEVGKEEKKDERQRGPIRRRRKESRGEESDSNEKQPTATPKNAKETVVVKVDLDGIHDRIAGLEIAPGNYSNLRLVDDRIFYLRRTVADEEGRGRRRGGRRRPESAISASTAWKIARRPSSATSTATRSRADGKKMLVKIKKDYAIIDLPKDKLETKDHELKLAGLDMQLDRHAEWNQIYYECLAADARFLLRAEHERRRLESDARQVCALRPVRESSQRSHLSHRRADW